MTSQTGGRRGASAFLAGSAAGDFGDQFWFLVLAFGAVSSGRPELAGSIIATAVAARAVSAPLGGYLVDRLDPRKVLGRSSAGQAVLYLLAGLALGFELAPLPVVLVACGVTRGLLEAIQEPNFSKIPPLIVSADELDGVAAVRQMSSRAALLVGAPAAGAVISLWGFAVALYGAALLTFAIVPALQFTHLRTQSDASGEGRERGFVREVLGGLTYLRVHAPVRSLVVTLAGLNVFTAPITALAFPLIASRHAWGAGTLGIIMSTLGLGGLVGGMIHLSTKGRFTMGHAQAGLAVQAIAIAVAAIPSLAAVLVSSALIGLSAGFSSPILSATFQRTVSPSHLGRVSSVLTVVDDSLMPVSLVVFGLIVAASNSSLAILSCAVGMLTLVIWHRSRRAKGRTESTTERESCEVPIP